MLKITLLSQKGHGLTIKLEGQILEPWVSAACAVRGRRPGAWTWTPSPTWTRRVFNCSAT
jgi:hypothetical protein